MPDLCLCGHPESDHPQTTRGQVCLATVPSTSRSGVEVSCDCNGFNPAELGMPLIFGNTGPHHPAGSDVVQATDLAVVGTLAILGQPTVDARIVHKVAVDRMPLPILLSSGRDPVDPVGRITEVIFDAAPRKVRMAGTIDPDAWRLIADDTGSAPLCMDLSNVSAPRMPASADILVIDVGVLAGATVYASAARRAGAGLLGAAAWPEAILKLADPQP